MTDTTTCPYCQHTRPEHDQHCLIQQLAELWATDYEQLIFGPTDTEE